MDDEPGEANTELPVQGLLQNRFPIARKSRFYRRI